ncbi:glycosyltransferase [bacterium]|nr:glycosyltransferase [bacterium]
MAVEFARRGHEVAWFESRYLRWLMNRPREFLRARTETPAPGLSVRPVALVNGERLPFIRAHNKYWLAHALNSVPAEHPRVLWLYNPHEAHLANSVAHDILIYDIMDEYQGFPWSPRTIAEEESELLSRADWVFAGTGALYDAKRPQAEGKIECILSGVDVELFAKFVVPPSGGDPEFERFRKHFKHVAGYAGMIDLRIDQELILAASKALPEWGFVLIGPVREAVSALQTLPNVLFTGAKPYDALPAYYHQFDAALLPFIENPLTRHINPTKMLEYAAAGVPIVARALPDVMRFYSDGAWLYTTADEFIAGLREIETGKTAEKIAASKTWIADRTWSAIADQMLNRLANLSTR